MTRVVRVRPVPPFLLYLRTGSPRRRPGKGPIRSGENTTAEAQNFVKRKSTTVFHDLDEFVTERMARFIPQDHQNEVVLRETWNTYGPWLGFRASVGEWSP